MNANMGFTPEHYKKFKKYAWAMLLGFSFLYAFLYNGRLNMGLALPMMTEQLHWSLSMAGVITSVLFWTYGFGHLFNGRLGEIFGVKRFIIAGIILTSLANVCISFLTSAVAIAILWGLNGYFQSMIWSPGMAMLSKWWPKKDRGFAAGFANGFSGIAQVVVWFAVMASISLAPAWGWRAAFRVPIISLLIMLVIFIIVVKEKPKDAGVPDYQEDDPEAVQREEELKEAEAKYGKLYPYKYLFGQWRFDVWCLITCLSNLCRYGLLTWIPMYYVEVLNMDVKSGIFKSVVLPAGMALGTFLVPWYTDRMKGNRLPAVMACGAISALSVFIFPHLTSMGSASVMLFLAGFFVYAINGVVWAYSTDVGCRQFSGTAAGILDWAAYMGAALEAVVFGRVLDKTGNWTFVFASIAVCCILMVVLAVIANKKPQNVVADQSISK